LSLAADATLRKALADRAWSKLRDVYSSAQMFARYDAIYRKVLHLEQADNGSGVSAVS
jgi:hypothetical protein